MSRANRVLTVIVLAITLAIGVTIFGAVVGVLDLAEASNHEVTGNSGEWHELNDENLPREVSVTETTGNALHFGSRSGSLEASVSNAGNDSVTVTTWAKLDEDASIVSDYHLLNLGNGDVNLQYTDGTWRGTANNSTHSASVTAPANDPKEWNALGLRTNSTHVSLWVNGTEADSAPLTVGGGEIKSARGWFGSVEEIREFGTAPSDAKMEELTTDATRGQPGTDRTFRMMLDESSGDTTRIFFADGSGSLSGDTTWTDGQTGPDFDEGTDYELDREEGQIQIDSGSRLADSPIAHVSYIDQMFATVTGIIGGFASAAKLAIIAMLSLMAVTVIKTVRGM